MQTGPNVIAFSYAKRALVKGSREYERMCEYAAVLGTYHVIVFTRDTENYPREQTSGLLNLHATNAKTRFGMIISAYKIAAGVIKKNSQMHWVLSGQDPFAASFVPWLLSFKKNVSLHVQVHGDIYNPYFFKGDILALCKRFFAKVVFTRAIRIRVVSKRIKDSLLERGVLEQKIVVLPIQSDIQPFLTVGRSRLEENRDTLHFLYVGRFAPEKDIALLLSSFALLLKKTQRWHLTLVGSGPCESAYRERIQKLGLIAHVTILSWQENVAELMKNMDILCLSSEHEGYAMVLLEALAAGLPVVTTNVGCAGEVVIDGETGLVVHERTAEAYAAALNTIVFNAVLRNQLREQTVRVAEGNSIHKEKYLEAIKNSFLV